MKKINIRFIADSAIIAALYVALTCLLAPISYGAIQFRISEILVLLVVLNPKYAYALVIGCFIANTTSVLGWYDMVFGTLATLLAVLPMLKIKRLEIAALFPVISNAFIVAIELLIAFNEPHLFWFNVLTVGLGEAVVLYCVGIPSMIALSKNEAMVDLLQIEEPNSYKSSFITLPRCIATVLGTVGVIFFIAYPFDAGTNCITIFIDYKWIVLLCVFSVLTIIVGLLLKGITKLVLNCLLFSGLFVTYVMIGVFVEGATVYGYYYGYCLYLVAYLALNGYVFYIEKLKNQAN